MDTLSYKTISANKATANKKWVLVDADGQTLGRLASKVAKLLRGKYKPDFTPHVDCGDNVIVINAEKINLTGNKWEDKTYLRHTGYPGGQRTTGVKQLLEKHPERMDGVHVPHDLTQEELAQLVGASRETVNKSLAEFVSRGWIRLEGRAVTLLDVDRLRFWHSRGESAKRHRSG